MNRSIKTTDQLPRKTTAGHADLTFKYLFHEIFFLEIELSDRGPKDTKELNKVSIELSFR